MITLIIFTLIAISAAQVCPPPEVLYPCKCTLSTLTEISCARIEESFNLKEIFDNASLFVPDDSIFTFLTIVGTQLSRIEDAAFQHLKFRHIMFAYNHKLTYISPRAFNASRDIVTEVLVWGNPIENETPNERDIFDFFNSFNNLISLDLMKSSVSSIPDNAFQNLNSLIRINLYENNISIIGSRPFFEVPRLKYLDLSKNSISSEGIHVDAFYGISDLMEDVKLGCNRIEYLEQDRFQPLLNQADRFYVGGNNSYCRDFEYARFLHCDERASWICKNEERFRGKLEGFLCKNETVYEDIWDYCSGSNSAFHV